MEIIVVLFAASCMGLITCLLSYIGQRIFKF